MDIQWKDEQEKQAAISHAKVAKNALAAKFPKKHYKRNKSSTSFLSWFNRACLTNKINTYTLGIGITIKKPCKSKIS